MWICETRDGKGRTVQRRLVELESSPALVCMPDGWTTTVRRATADDISSIREDIKMLSVRKNRKCHRKW